MKHLYHIQTALSVLLALLMLSVIVLLTFANASSVKGSVSVPVFDNRTAVYTADYLLMPTVQTPEREQIGAEIEAEPEFVPDEDDVNALAQMAYGEARGVKSTTEKAASMWCVLNRVDDSQFPDTVIGVVSQAGQFAGYSKNNPVTDELRELAVDVLIRYHNEQEGNDDVGRVLPAEYLYFSGDGKHNHFRIHLKDKSTYTWWLESPYED